MNFVVYDQEGQIVRHGFTDSERNVAIQAIEPGEKVMIFNETYDGMEDDFMINMLADTPIPRPDNPTTLRTDKNDEGYHEIILESVPLPSKITINGKVYEEKDDGIFVLETDLDGNYSVSVDCFPYRKLNWNVVLNG